MEKPVCRTCPYWEVTAGNEDGSPSIGNCQRHAPVFPPTQDMFEAAVNVDNDSGAWTGWQPETLPGESCGEHPDFPSYIAMERFKRAVSAQE